MLSSSPGLLEESGVGASGIGGVVTEGAIGAAAGAVLFLAVVRRFAVFFAGALRATAFLPAFFVDFFAPTFLVDAFAAFLVDFFAALERDADFAALFFFVAFLALPAFAAFFLVPFRAAIISSSFFW